MANECRGHGGDMTLGQGHTVGTNMRKQPGAGEQLADRNWHIQGLLPTSSDIGDRLQFCTDNQGQPGHALFEPTRESVI